jgi:hypothetical protein
MTDKRIPLYAKYGYAKVEEITPEQWEAFRKIPLVAVTEESSVVLQIIPDAQQIIKAAVQAIEDVVEGDYGKYTDGDDCLHGKLEAEVCQYCINEKLKPHLEALKGLIDEQV